MEYGEEIADNTPTEALKPSQPTHPPGDIDDKTNKRENVM